MMMFGHQARIEIIATSGWKINMGDIIMQKMHSPGIELVKSRRWRDPVDGVWTYIHTSPYKFRTNSKTS